MADLLGDYLAGNEALLARYGGAPATLFDTSPAPRAWDPGLIRAMRDYNARIGSEAPFAGNEAVVVTGQQPALFAGPLYTVYKAITTLHAAAEITKRHGVPCIPIFWVGSEDHDFDEACAVSFLTTDHRVERVHYAPQSRPDGLPMYRVALDDSLHAEIDRMHRDSPGSEHADRIAAFLHDALNESESLAEWSARILAKLFEGTPLVFFAPHLPEARRVNAPLIAAEIDDPLQTSSIVNAGAEALEKLGYDAQLLKGEHDCNFFLEVKGRRRKVEYHDGKFHLPEEKKSMSRDDLSALLEAEPERFSTNVALRCIAQQRLFPAAAYVAGPGELAYWGQLHALFDAHNETMPIVYPRIRALLSDAKCEGYLERYALTRRQALGGDPEAVTLEALRAAYRGPNLDALKNAREHSAALLTSLHSNLLEPSPTAAKMTTSLANDLNRKWDAIERTLLHEADGREQTVRRHITRLCNTFQPNRKPQERIFTICGFLFRHGWELVPRLTRELDVMQYNYQGVIL